MLLVNLIMPLCVPVSIGTGMDVKTCEVCCTVRVCKGPSV